MLYGVRGLETSQISPKLKEEKNNNSFFEDHLKMKCIFYPLKFFKPSNYQEQH